jgi:FKBP-type peptidyl-prolyl cis-trans isomerase
MNLTHKKQKLSTLLVKALSFFVVLISFSACKQENTNPYYITPEQIEAQKKFDEETIRKYFRANNVDTTQVVRTNSGLYYLQVKEGEGEKVKAGQQVKVHYIGKDIFGRKFDSSYDRGDGFTFVVGSGQVIQGWDEGLQLMKQGEAAFLYIPSYLGYGYRGSQSIAPNSVLVFEIDVLNVR